MSALARGAGVVVVALSGWTGPASAQDVAGRPLSLMEDCLVRAVADGELSQTDDSYKYICGGEPAQHLWDFWQAAGAKSWTQQTPDEGEWQSIEFPLGGCFKRVRHSDGTPATSGLSCSIWIPRAKPAE